MTAAKENHLVDDVDISRETYKLIQPLFSIKEIVENIYLYHKPINMNMLTRDSAENIVSAQSPFPSACDK